MDEPTSEFLDDIRRSHTLPPGSEALDAARAVFYALLRADSEDGCRRIAGFFPEELETLWKPAFYRCLREQRRDEGPSMPRDVEGRMRVHSPELGEGDPTGLARAVLEALASRLEDGERRDLAETLPDELKDSLDAS